MKKSNFVKTVTTILLFGGGLAFLAGLISCDNFLKGSDVLKELEESIKYANAEEYTLIIKSNAAYGSFLSEGEKKCKVGYSIDLQFTVTTEDYYFSGLEAVSTSDSKISRSDYVEITTQNPEEAKSSGVYKITLKLLKGINDILITPKFEKLENADIRLDGEHGDFLPEKDTYNLIIGRSFNLSFDPNEDWEFIRWKIYDEESGEEIPDGTYLTFKDISRKNTSFVFNGIPESQKPKIVITAIVSKRPQIISYGPMNLGHFKDSTIQVLFDKNMDENSIYYTDPEIDALIKSGIPGSAFLPPLPSSGNPTKHYGYVKDEKTYFKNIVLTNNKTGANINDRFAEPFFEDSRTLSIPANKTAGHVLDDFTQVLVSIEEGFFYSEPLTDTTSKPVTLSQSKSWMYQVNNSNDNKPLAIPTGKFSAKWKSDNTELTKSSSTFTLNQSGFEAMRFVKDGNFKFDLNIEVQEQGTGSGPNSYFTVKVKKIYGVNYAASTYEKSFTPYYQNVTSDTAVFNGSVDLKQEEISLGDGVYEMIFEFRDRSGNLLTYPSGSHFYFAVDTKAPEISTPTISSTNSTTYTLAWSDYVDLKTAEITCGKNGATPTSLGTISKGTKSKNIENIEPNNSYVLKIKFTDYAGNSTTKTVPKFLTGYSFTGTLNFMGNNASHAQNIFLVGDKISDYGITSAKKYYSDGSSTTVSLTTSIPTRSSYNSSWTFTDTYSEGNISKKAELSGTYYIAKKDSLTQRPVYDPDYHERDNSGDKHYKFGDFPQTVSKISSYTSSPVYNGWYLGSDGYFYEKQTANNSADRNKFSNGNTISNGTDYYFKVEPIYWRALTTNYDHDQNSSTAGKTFLFADKVLKNGIPFYLNQSERTINGSKVDSNSWRYSTMRAYLNGAYESGDPQETTYSGKGFLQKAFTSSAQSLIATTSVKNDARETNPSNNGTLWNGGINPFAETPTSDKIFLLSMNEITYGGFSFNPNGGEGAAWSHRGREPSDYALSVSSYVSPKVGFGAYYWQRSSCYYTKQVRWVDTAGNATNGGKYVDDNLGIVPALVLVDAP